MTPEFLSVEDVVEIHAAVILRYGGAPGLRDQGLLESAAAQASASFDGVLLQGDLFAMAAAYLFHIVKNHPVVDGNKRAGLLATLVFLELNGVSLVSRSERLYDLTIAVAEGRCEKEEISQTLRSLLESA